MGNARSRSGEIDMRIPFPVREIARKINQTLGLELGIPLRAKIAGLPEADARDLELSHEGRATFLFEGRKRIDVKFETSFKDGRMHISVKKLAFHMKVESAFKAHCWGMRRGLDTRPIRTEKALSALKSAPGSKDELILFGTLDALAIAAINAAEPDVRGHVRGLNLDARLKICAYDFSPSKAA